MVYGLWFMVYGLWFMVYGLWFMVYGLWFMVYDNPVSEFALSRSSCAAYAAAAELVGHGAPFAGEAAGLKAAAREGRVGELRRLLEAGVPADYGEGTPGTALLAAVGLCTLNQVDPYPIAYSLSNP
jgi:hypothetical protein